MGYEDEQLRSREKPLDLKRIPIKEVLDHLECTRAGLKSDEAQRRLKIFDVNMPEEKQEIKLLKFLGFMWNPLSLVLEIGAIMAIALDESRDWEIFVGILVLLIINATISFIMENNAGNAAASLGARVAPQARILRDGCWIKEDAAILVPGDIICIKQGDIVPADARLLKGGPIKIDQSALTGVSLPVTKVQEDVVYSGTTCKQGDTEAVVIATGVKSFLVKLAGYCDSRENDVGHFQKLWTSIGVLCILWTSLAVIIEMFVMHFQHRADRESMHNLLVLLIGGIPIALPTLLSVTTLSGSRRLSEQGAIIKRMSAIEDMAGMDVLCCDKTGTLTLNKLTVDKNLIKVFSGWRVDDVVRMAARASGIENQDAVDAAILEMLDDPNKARAGIQELHFLPFDPANKMSALTYLDSKGMHRVTKGAPDQILNLCPNNCEVVSQVHAVIEKFAKRGFRSLAVAYQSLPQGRIESEQAPWQFIGVMPLFDPLRGDSAETIRKALNLGVKVKMLTGDQLAIAQETGRQLGMGIDMHHSSTLFGENKNKHKLIVDLSDEIIDKADGFAGARPGHKYEIINHLQARKHICGMIGDGVNDAAAFMKADISIAVADSTDAARSASDIVLTEPGLSVIISAVLTGRAISQRMKSYSIYAVSITIRTLLGFMLLALIWKFDFPPFMMLMMAIVNTGTMMVISKDRVRPSHLAVSWTLAEILATGVILGSYLAMTTVIFFWAAYKTNFIEDHFGVASLHKDDTDAMRKLASAVYLQVSTISHALIFVTRSRSWSYVERPRGHGFFITQLIATLIAVYANWSFCAIEGIGWRWAGIIWLYNIVIYLPLDLIKFFIRHVLTTLGLLITQERSEQNQLAEDAKQLAKVARKKKLPRMKGHAESVGKLKKI